MTTIERDYTIVFNQRIDRPENIIPGDWLVIWDRFENPVDYQEAFDEGVKSVPDNTEALECRIEDLKDEIRDLEIQVKEAYDDGFEEGKTAGIFEAIK